MTMVALAGRRKWHIGTVVGGRREPLCGSFGVDRGSGWEVEDDFFLGSDPDPGVCRRCLASVAPMRGFTV